MIAGRERRVLVRSCFRTGRRGIAKSSAVLRVRRRPRHRAGRFVDILSKSVVVTEVDVIELPVDHDCDRSFQFLFRGDEGKIQEGRKVE